MPSPSVIPVGTGADLPLRLVKRLQPLPFESLQSLLARLQVANYYEISNWWLLLTGIRPGTMPDQLRARSHYAELAEITGLSVDTLYGLTLHRFAPRYYDAGADALHGAGARTGAKAGTRVRAKPEYDDLERPLWSKAGLCSHVHGTRQGGGLNYRVCPACWREDGAVLLPWRLQAVTTCPKHRVLLVDLCQGCGQSIRANWATGRCLRCDAEIASFEAISISDDPDSLDLADLVSSALGLQLDAEGDSMAMPDPEMPIPQQADGGATPQADSWLPPRINTVLAPEHPLQLMSPPAFLHFLYRFSTLLPARDPDNPRFASERFVPGMGEMISGVRERALSTAESEPREGNARGAAPVRRGGVAFQHWVHLAVWGLLQDWPTEWHSALERIARREAELSAISNKTKLSYVLAREFTGPQWGWLQGEWMGFIQERAAYSPTLYPWLRHYRAALQQGGKAILPDAGFQNAQSQVGLPMLSQREAAHELGVSEPTVKDYIERGALNASANVTVTNASDSIGRNLGGKRQWRLVDAGSVQRLREEHSTWLTLAQAAAKCGLAEDKQLVALVAAGLVEAAQGPLVDGAATWRFAPAVVQRFLDNVLEQVPQLPAWAAALGPIDSNDDSNEQGEQSNPDEHVECVARAEPSILSLYKALRITTWQGIGLAALLVEIKRGGLRAYRHGDSADNIGSLHFERAGLLEYLARRRRLAEGGDLLYTARDVCNRLRCKPVSLRRWYAAGMLVPCRDEMRGSQVHWRYSRQDVETFVERYIDSGQAAEILGCTDQAVLQWAKRGWLPVVAGPLVDGSREYRFDRQAIIEWRRERVTFAEAWHMLGISRSGVNYWIRAGKIRPVDTGDKKHRWYSRVDVERAVLQRRPSPQP
ncbi:MAG: TniQ family protein [Chloroflexi bacterium]|nr:TniQ family protein [Chloroflexota bacterium]